MWLHEAYSSGSCPSSGNPEPQVNPKLETLNPKLNPKHYAETRKPGTGRFFRVSGFKFRNLHANLLNEPQSPPPPPPPRERSVWVEG